MNDFINVRNQLIDGLENDFTDEQVQYIDKRLKEIADENNLSADDLDYYCWADSSLMFDCIFSGKTIDPDLFG